MGNCSNFEEIGKILPMLKRRVKNLEEELLAPLPDRKCLASLEISIFEFHREIIGHLGEIKNDILQKLDAFDIEYSPVINFGNLNFTEFEGLTSVVRCLDRRIFNFLMVESLKTQ